MSTEPYVPSEEELIDCYAGLMETVEGKGYDNAYADAKRGIAQIKADALREARSLLSADGFFCPALDDRIEEEADD